MTATIVPAVQPAAQIKPVLGAGATLCSAFTVRDEFVTHPDGSFSVKSPPKDPMQVDNYVAYNFIKIHTTMRRRPRWPLASQVGCSRCQTRESAD
jgi:hypothetical protein